jgi:hypothetical protein
MDCLIYYGVWEYRHYLYKTNKEITVNQQHEKENTEAKYRMKFSSVGYVNMLSVFR